MDTHLPRLILDLATVLGVAAVITLLFRLLKLPAVLGYMLAGLIVGPHVPVPLVADLEIVQTMAELGVVLLMFSVGLEFDYRKLLDKGPAAMGLGAVQLGLTTLLGFLAGRALGWGFLPCAFMGAALAISSTMIIAKLFEEHGGRGHLRDRVLTVLVIQDLFAIVLLAGLDAITAAGEGGAQGMLPAALRIVLFLAGILGVGGLTVPRLLRWAADRGRAETLLVAAMGVCFTAAVLAAKAGCSLALGAFLAGVLAGASGRVAKIELLVLPLRDMFGAIFFVAIGMLLDPRSLAAQAGPILAFTAVVLAGDTVGSAVGGALAGLPLRAGFRTGLALAQPGEFSFVLVSTGISAGFLPPDFMAVPVGACLLLALLGPTLFRRGDAIAAGLERRLPDRLNWSLKTYQSWVASLGRSSLGRGPVPMRRPLVYLFVDAILINGTIIGAALLRRNPSFQSPRAALWRLVGEGLVLLVLARSLCARALEIANRIVVPAERATAPPAGRTQLVGALSLALLLLVGAPSLAVLQPFLPEGPMLGAFLAGLVGVFGLLWFHSIRYPADRKGGAEWLVNQVQASLTSGDAPQPPPAGDRDLLSVSLGPQCPYLGRPLGELHLEELTGAAVLGYMRDGRPVSLDPGLELNPGDLLAICGPPEALAAATRLLGGHTEA